jgi:hypothetical protein
MLANPIRASWSVRDIYLSLAADSRDGLLICRMADSERGAFWNAWPFRKIIT